MLTQEYNLEVDIQVNRAEAKAEGKAEGKVEGKAEGIAETFVAVHCIDEGLGSGKSLDEILLDLVDLGVSQVTIEIVFQLLGFDLDQPNNEVTTQQ